MQAILGKELGILHRLGSGRSIDEFQQNLLQELRATLDWDCAVFMDNGQALPCPSGLWQPPGIPSKTWQTWCHRITEAEAMNTWLLLILDIAPLPLQKLEAGQSLGILLLRRDRPFTPSEVETLTHIHRALQKLLDQAMMLDRLMQQESLPDPSAPKNSDPIHLSSDRTGKNERTECFMIQPLMDLGLTRRQAEVMNLVIKGKDINAIALDLGCCKATVHKHMENLYRRLGVQTRTAAIAHILEQAGVL
jgi:DNA-binding CsgD family transcriptional regulator